MTIFTKILRPAFGYLRQEGYLSVIFVDDSYLQGNIESNTYSVWKILKLLWIY